jgi:hypothetical protein
MEAKMINIDTFENDGNELVCSACCRLIERGEVVTITECSKGLRLTCSDCQDWLEKAMDWKFLQEFERIRKAAKQGNKFLTFDVTGINIWPSDFAKLQKGR